MKEASVHKLELINATLEEDVDKKECSFTTCQIVGWVEKGSVQEYAQNLRIRIEALDIPIASASRVSRNESQPKAFIIRSMDMNK